MHRADDSARTAAPFDIAIIGGGASGALAAIHLLRAAGGASLRLALFDPSGRPGRGVAYGTSDDVHLLNVPAGAMSAYRDLPADFVDWLRSRRPDATPDAFAQRRLYGDYLGDALAAARAAAPRCAFELRAAEVVGVARAGGRWRLTTDDGAQATAAVVVLALGHGVPVDPAVLDGGLYGSGRYFRGPWAMDAARVGAGASNPAVLLLGTGLTMVDAMLKLLAAGRAGPFVAISRRGLPPRPHASAPVAAYQGWALQPPPGDLRGLVRRIRAEAARAEAQGVDWRAVVDGLRPHTARLWQQLSPPDRRRFLRHARPYWDVHRHRVAPEVGRVLEAAIASGQLRVIAGRVVRFENRPDFVEAHVRPRGETATTLIRAGAVINCTSPGTRVGPHAPPVMRALLASGALRADAVGFGPEVDDVGRVIAADGRAQGTLYAIGPLRRGMLWESMAIPEIRVQAQDLAERIVPALAAVNASAQEDAPPP